MGMDESSCPKQSTNCGDANSRNFGFQLRAKGAPMKYRHTALKAILGQLIAFGWGSPSWSAQQASSGTVPVSTGVSVEARHGKDIRVAHRGDARVCEEPSRLHIADWSPPAA